uniref:Chitinase n=1 Tax=Palpitomonas bilix TaxID=652834 RepID=A0A7S3G638_9EUKA|mmetsp:Transcript_28750/g.73518  ORF Transcript_28750/g.73518 Transcript_28750/m.73518 type:complete len:1146 (+) Transcript_28750:218-3655(+)
MVWRTQTLAPVVAAVVVLCLAGVVSSKKYGSIDSGNAIVPDPLGPKGAYYTNWAQYRPGVGKYVPEDMEKIANKLDYATYGFGAFDISTGRAAAVEWNDLPEGEWDSRAMIPRFNSIKNSHPHMKTLWSIGGWNFGSYPFSKMAKDKTMRATFIQTCIEFARQHDFDGIDLDWEYPASGEKLVRRNENFPDRIDRGGEAGDTQTFSELLEDFRRAIIVESEQSGKPMLYLTIATAANPKVAKDTDWDRVHPVLDLILLMSYDFNGAWQKEVGPNAPLFAPSSEALPNATIDNAVHYYLEEAKVPAQKISFGLASYGRTWTVDSTRQHQMGDDGHMPSSLQWQAKLSDNLVTCPAPNDPDVCAIYSGKPGSYTRSYGFLSWYELKLQGFVGKAVHDTNTRTSFAQVGDVWATFDSPHDLREKVAYAKSKSFHGVFFWALDLDNFYDGHDLFNAAFDEYTSGNTPVPTGCRLMGVCEGDEEEEQKGEEEEGGNKPAEEEEQHGGSSAGEEEEQTPTPVDPICAKVVGSGYVCKDNTHYAYCSKGVASVSTCPTPSVCVSVSSLFGGDSVACAFKDMTQDDDVEPAKPCPENCNGNGVCNGETGKCTCKAGFVGVACDETQSENEGEGNGEGSEDSNNGGEGDDSGDEEKPFLSVGYVENMRSGGVEEIKNIDFDSVTHIIHGFATISSDGANIIPLSKSLDAYAAVLIPTAHSHQTKVLLSLGGATAGSSPFTAACANLATFVSNAVAYLEERGYDGIDVDWESPGTDSEIVCHANLMKALHDALHPKGLLTAIAVQTGYYIDMYDYPSLSTSTDFAFYMGYDWGQPSNGPLTNPGAVQWTKKNHQIEKSCRGAVEYMIKAGYPSSKVVLGLPFYSSAKRSWFQFAPTYQQVKNTLEVHGDYLEVQYNNEWWSTPEAIKAKMDAVLLAESSVLTNQQTLAGVGFWEFGHESFTSALPHHELSTAIREWIEENNSNNGGGEEEGGSPTPSCGANGHHDPKTGKCDCDLGYVGDKCESRVCPNDCSNHGKCDANTGTCTCNAGYEGIDCSQDAPTPIKPCPNDCSGHGTCNTVIGTCTCSSGYTGSDCSTTETESEIDCAAASSGTQFCVESGVHAEYVTCLYGSEVTQSCAPGTKCYSGGNGAVYCDW